MSLGVPLSGLVRMHTHDCSSAFQEHSMMLPERLDGSSTSERKG